jgi:hypothetical protein
MIKRLLLALAMIAALAGCNTPAGTASPTTNDGTPASPGLESPSDSGLESVEPSEEASDAPSEEASEEPSPS